MDDVFFAPPQPALDPTVSLPWTTPRLRPALVLEASMPNSPFASRTSWTHEVAVADVRAQARRTMAQQRPVTSRSDKVKGLSTLAPPTTRKSLPAASALLVLNDDVDPSLLFTKAPGFSSGVSFAVAAASSTPAAAAAAAATVEPPPPLQPTVPPSMAADSFNQDDDDDTTVNANTKSSTVDPEDENKTPTADGHWAVLDDSDTSNFHDVVPQMAIHFPFELDPFQKRAVVHLERGESVFVAAHTSAGKTVVAEVAVALAFEHRTRIVYTSPIKALSNQKFRDFADKFGRDKVGLLTGDNSVNPDAPCVIMTTEILRSMLFRGADMTRDIEFVVFDEIHYINDPERGVIWEEVVILLPLHVHVVMLSATTPNTLEFSSWVGRNRRERVHVVSTDKRPVPLEHFLYAGGQMHKIMDAHNRFLEDGHKSAAAALRAKDPLADAPGAHDKGMSRGRREQLRQQQAWAHSQPRHGARSDNAWLDLVKHLGKLEMLPVIIFTFSKNAVAQRAEYLSKLDLLSHGEKSAAHLVMHRALQRLHESDRQLPQITRVSELLSRGIGIHHGGLLPLMKEVVEICFAKGIVKVLIATETFAMGVNAPCRTVVFGGLRKHDGSDFRDLLPGEYTQMCGRAGRRGLDSVGTVLIFCDGDVPPLATLAAMLSGRASKLQSKFRLRYAMMLNLLRADELSVKEMMKRSFSEFARGLLVRPLAGKLRGLKDDAALADKAVRDYGCVLAERGAAATDIEDFARVATRAQRQTRAALTEMLRGDHGHRARDEVLRSGRVVLVAVDGMLLPAVVASCSSSKPQSSDVAIVVAVAVLPAGFVPPALAPRLNVDVAAAAAAAPAAVAGSKKSVMAKRRGRRAGGNDHSDDDSDDDEFALAKKKKKKAPPVFFERGVERPASSSAQANALPRACYAPDGSLALLCLGVEDIVKVLPDCVAVLDDKQVARLTAERSLNACAAVAAGLKTMTLASMLPRSLDIVKELKAAEHVLVVNWKEAEASCCALGQSLCAGCPAFNEHHAMAMRAVKARAELASVRAQLSDDNLTLFPDLSARLALLRKMGYVAAEDDAVQLKGRVACEVNTCDELLLCEMIFDNVFDKLDAAESAALLSALVLQAKCDDAVEPPTAALGEAFAHTLRIAQTLEQRQLDEGVMLEADWVKAVLNPGLLSVVWEWARGRPFASLMRVTSLDEGIIVRAITRLDETCREVKSAARLLGDPLLLQKMEQASKLIKRDVCFATSLYVA